MKLSVNTNGSSFEKREYTPVPADIYQAVCVDIEDMGWKKGSFGWKGEIKFYFEVFVENEETSEEKAMLTKTKAKNAVISPRSYIYKNILKSWIGDEELGSGKFDLSTLIGRSATIVVEDGEPFTGSNGEEVEWTFVEKCKAAKLDVKPSGQYVRVIEREGYEAPEFSAFTSGPPEAIAEREAKRAEAKAEREAKKIVKDTAKEVTKEDTDDEVPF